MVELVDNAIFQRLCHFGSDCSELLVTGSELLITGNVIACVLK